VNGSRYKLFSKERTRPMPQIHNQRFPHEFCQGHVVRGDLPTLGKNSKQSQSESTNQEAKDLATISNTRRTVRELRADCPRAHGGPSARYQQTVRKRLANLQYCTNNNEPSVEAHQTVREQHPPRALFADPRRTVCQTPCNRRQLGKQIETKARKNK
jgi:hypothetical protein